MDETHDSAEGWKGLRNLCKQWGVSPKALGAIIESEAVKPKRHLDEDMLAAAIGAPDKAIKQQRAHLTPEERASAQAAIYAAGWNAPETCATSIVAFLRLLKGKAG